MCPFFIDTPKLTPKMTPKKKKKKKNRVGPNQQTSPPTGPHWCHVQYIRASELVEVHQPGDVPDRFWWSDLSMVIVRINGLVITYKWDILGLFHTYKWDILGWKKPMDPTSPLIRSPNPSTGHPSMSWFKQRGPNLSRWSPNSQPLSFGTTKNCQGFFFDEKTWQPCSVSGTKVVKLLVGPTCIIPWSTQRSCSGIRLT